MTILTTEYIIRYKQAKIPGVFESFLKHINKIIKINYKERITIEEAYKEIKKI